MASSTIRPSGRRAIGRVLRSRGFTLIELMIVVAIIAILAAIAYPSYINYIVKTKRNAAEACLSEYANYMERYYTTNLSYAADTSTPPVANPLSTTPPTLVLGCASTTQTGNDYAYTLPTASLTAGAYMLLATPINAQLTRDTTCGALALDQTGARYVKGNDNTPADVAVCWK